VNFWPGLLLLNVDGRALQYAMTGRT